MKKEDVKKVMLPFMKQVNEKLEEILKIKREVDEIVQQGDEEEFDMHFSDLLENDGEFDIVYKEYDRIIRELDL